MCFVLTGLLLWTGLSASCRLGATEVVANIDVPLQSLTQAQLRNIFTLRQVLWPDGSAITVFVMPADDILHQQFSKQQLRLFPYQLNNLWDRQSFSGLAGRPQLVENSLQMLERLKSTPGSIGYVAHFEGDAMLKELQIEQ